MAKPWREVLKIHPAAELFPLMSPDELATLAKDIKVHGLKIPVVFWKSKGQRYLLDGRNRLDALQINGGLGHPVFDHQTGCSNFDFVTVPNNTDPYQYVISANIHRRHLNIEQRAALAHRPNRPRAGKI
jgi:hypothetical protein